MIGSAALLGISWHDSNWIPILNASNILDYFSERSNPFYDKTCNNEIIKMQRLNPSHLNNMEGIEYVLLHVQEPILYVIRKQHRHANAINGSGITPLADYYVIAGIVYQSPDLGSIVNSRLMNTIYNLQSAFNECLSYTQYHPSKGYSWMFNSKDVEDKNSKKTEKVKEEPSSVFQRQRVDMLLVELSKKFAPRGNNQQQAQAAEPAIKAAPGTPFPQSEESTQVKQEGKENTAVKPKLENSIGNTQNQPKIKPPPEKKPRLM